MGGGGGRGGGGSVGRSGRAGGRGGGREQRRGARGLWRARAPRLEKKEEPGRGGGLTRFPDVQGPPTPSASPNNRPQGTCSGTSPAGGGSPGAPGALHPTSTPRGRSGALAPPETAPRGSPPGLPGGPEVPRGLPLGVCESLGPRGPAGSGATRLRSRGKEVLLPLEGKGLITPLLCHQHTHTGPSSTDIRGIRQREVSLIA